jgi:hypothetical protein
MPRKRLKSLKNKRSKSRSRSKPKSRAKNIKRGGVEKKETLKTNNGNIIEVIKNVVMQNDTEIYTNEEGPSRITKEYDPKRNLLKKTEEWLTGETNSPSKRIFNGDINIIRITDGKISRQGEESEYIKSFPLNYYKKEEKIGNYTNYTIYYCDKNGQEKILKYVK